MFEKQPLDFDAAAFVLKINGPISQSASSSGFFIRDLRIWSRALSPLEVFTQRHQEIRHPELHDDLLVYAPLTEGARYPFKFFDLLSQRSFKTENLEMINPNEDELDPLVCPSYTFYNHGTSTCVVDFLEIPQAPEGFLMKGRNDDGYTLSIEDLRFADEEGGYFRQLADETVAYDWSVASVASPADADLVSQIVSG